LGFTEVRTFSFDQQIAVVSDSADRGHELGGRDITGVPWRRYALRQRSRPSGDLRHLPRSRSRGSAGASAMWHPFTVSTSAVTWIAVVS